MARSRTWYPKLIQFFPKDEPVARLMARLFVLWQDLLYEQTGIIEDDGFQVLDRKGSGDLQRRLYFLRANSRTLNSAKNLFDNLVADPTFSGWLEEDARLSARVFEAKELFDRHRQAVDRVRNSVGAHVEKDVGDAIANFVPGDYARFELHSEDVMRPHLATEILLAALTPGAPEAKRLEAYRAAVAPLAKATNAMISAMAEVAAVYMTRFRLFP